MMPPITTGGGWSASGGDATSGNGDQSSGNNGFGNVNFGGGGFDLKLLALVMAAIIGYLVFKL